jgi:hypothetical protein
LNRASLRFSLANPRADHSATTYRAIQAPGGAQVSWISADKNRTSRMTLIAANKSSIVERRNREFPVMSYPFGYRR